MIKMVTFGMDLFTNMSSLKPIDCVQEIINTCPIMTYTQTDTVYWFSWESMDKQTNRQKASVNKNAIGVFAF